MTGTLVYENRCMRSFRIEGAMFYPLYDEPSGGICTWDVAFCPVSAVYEEDFVVWE